MTTDDKRTIVSQGFTLWLMGPTSSGKTTLAELLNARFLKDGITTLHYDGDEVRNLFGKCLKFAAADRLRVVSTLVHLANRASTAGINVIVSALTANEDARNLVRNNVLSLIVGYVKCPIKICAERDPKGLYSMAKNGDINTLIGINSKYHPPEDPSIIIDTEALSSRQAVDLIVKFLRQSGHLD